MIKLKVLRGFALVVLLFFTMSFQVKADTFIFSKNLHTGTLGKNVEVMVLQQFLFNEGFYEGPITGNFRTLTKKAVKAFQKSKGISSTGYFGPITRGEVNKSLSLQTEPEFEQTSVVIVPESFNTKTNDPVELQARLDYLLNEALKGQSAASLQSRRDRTAPVIAEVTPVPTPSENKTPSYTFSSTEAGVIVYGGGCASATKNAVMGNNTIVFNSLAPGNYFDCNIKVRDVAGNRSKLLYISDFVITSPVVIPPTTPPTNTSGYPLHTNITATVFWVGEPQGAGSSEDNALSAWDDAWQAHYGGYDDYVNRNGYYPVGFTPKENPFYLDFPYNDFNNNGVRKVDAFQVVPWANEKTWGSLESLMKNRWVKIMKNGNTCYGQIEDAGPYVYNDYKYVFGTTDPRPQSTTANNAGMDVSPALRDCLKFNGLNNADNKVDWQFVNFADVPEGPWKQIITTSQIYWP